MVSLQTTLYKSVSNRFLKLLLKRVPRKNKSCNTDQNVINSVVFELWESPRDLPSVAIAAAELFVSGRFSNASTDGRCLGSSLTYFSSIDPRLRTQKPLAVLNQRQTASSCKILTGAVQHLYSMILVASYTFGKVLFENTTVGICHCIKIQGWSFLHIQLELYSPIRLRAEWSSIVVVSSWRELCKWVTSSRCGYCTWC